MCSAAHSNRKGQLCELPVARHPTNCYCQRDSLYLFPPVYRCTTGHLRAVSHHANFTFYLALGACANLACIQRYISCVHYSCGVDNGLSFAGGDTVIACGSRCPHAIYAGVDLDRGDCWTIRKNGRRASAFSYPIIFLPFISSAFVPTESMPSVVRAFAENQPITSLVETIRMLLSSQPVGNDIWVALAWCVGILLAAYFFAMRVYKKRM